MNPIAQETAPEFPTEVRVFVYGADGLCHDDSPAAPPSTPAGSSQPLAVVDLTSNRETELEEAVTPPLPRSTTDLKCGRCSAQLPGLPPTCLECGTKIYHQCLYCAEPDPTPVRCHYASRHPFNKGSYLCVGCAMICDKCEVDICADCGRTCSVCEDHICWGCSGVEEASRIGDVCPKCEAKQGKRPKTDGEGAGEAVVEVAE